MNTLKHYLKFHLLKIIKSLDNALANLYFLNAVETLVILPQCKNSQFVLLCFLLLLPITFCLNSRTKQTDLRGSGQTEVFLLWSLTYREIQLLYVASKVKVMLLSGAWVDSNNSRSSSQSLIPAQTLMTAWTVHQHAIS